VTDSVYLVKAIKIPDLLFASISSQIDRIYGLVQKHPLIIYDILSKLVHKCTGTGSGFIDSKFQFLGPFRKVI
jgi:hypothetical protein